MRWRRGAGLVGLWLTSLLMGCGNKEKAQMMLMINSSAKHPEVMQAMAAHDVAVILAMMQLQPKQAAALKDWAASDGETVRGEVEGQVAKVAAILPKLKEADLALLKQKAGTAAQQDALLTKVLGDQRKVVDSEEPPVDIDDVIQPHAEKLMPVVRTLSERQRLVALGQWQEAAKAIDDYLKLPKDAGKEDVESARDGVVDNVLEARGHGMIKDEAAEKKCRALVDKIPRSKPGTDAEQELAKLVKAIPHENVDDLMEQTAATLATLLCQESAGELLAQVN